MSDIHRQLKKGDSLAFEKTDLYQQVFRLADKKAAKRCRGRCCRGSSLRARKLRVI
jgi:hypothetical protein